MNPFFIVTEILSTFIKCCIILLPIHLLMGYALASLGGLILQISNPQKINTTRFTVEDLFVYSLAGLSVIAIGFKALNLEPRVYLIYAIGCVFSALILASIVSWNVIQKSFGQNSNDWISSQKNDTHSLLWGLFIVSVLVIRFILKAGT